MYDKFNFRQKVLYRMVWKKKLQNEIFHRIKVIKYFKYTTHETE